MLELKVLRSWKAYRRKMSSWLAWPRDDDEDEGCTSMMEQDDMELPEDHSQFPEYPPGTEGCSIWIRTDFGVTSFQTTLYPICGPAWSTVLWLRTIELERGVVLEDGPVQQESRHQMSTNIGEHLMPKGIRVRDPEV